MVRVQTAPSLIPTPRRTGWPSVGVVVVTRGRPHQLRRALRSITAQNYPGAVRAVVVHDREAPDWEIACAGDRPIMVLENWRAPGRAGAFNTGILAVADCELVAFCDDRDTWASAKLLTQVAALRTQSRALLCTCTTEVEFDGRRTPHPTGETRIGPRSLVPSRVGLLRVSGFIAEQTALSSSPGRGGVGLIDESAPTGAEEWDLLVRAAAVAPILHLDTPLVRAMWRPVPTDVAAASAEIEALLWMLARHPALAVDRAWSARVYGELACWSAAAGDTTDAWRWATAAARRRWYTPAGARALAAAAGVLRGAALANSLREHRLP